MRTSTLVATLAGTLTVLGLAAWVGAGQRKATLLPPASPELLDATKITFASLMAMIRGEKLLPPALLARAQEIVDQIARKRAAGVSPAATREDLETLYSIARS